LVANDQHYQAHMHHNIPKCIVWKKYIWFSTSFTGKPLFQISLIH